MVWLTCWCCIWLVQEPSQDSDSDDHREKIVQVLIDAMDDEESQVRKAAFQALVAVAPDAEETKDAFSQAIIDPDESVAASAVSFLGRSKMQSDAKVALLLDLLSTGSPQVRNEARSQITPYPAEAARGVGELLASNMLDDVFRDALLQLVTQWGHEASDAIPAVIRLMHERDDYQLKCLATLSAMGKKAQAATDDVAALIKDESADVRLQAIYTLAAFSLEPGEAPTNFSRYDDRFLTYAKSMMQRYDVNLDGRISGDEINGMRGFQTMDRNGDKILTQQEILEFITDRSSPPRELPSPR